MYSPFYTAEQKALYPHRDINVSTAEQVKDLITKVINNGTNNISVICTTSLRELKYIYFPNADTNAIMDGITLYKKENN